LLPLFLLTVVEVAIRILYAPCLSFTDAITWDYYLLLRLKPGAEVSYTSDFVTRFHEKGKRHLHLIVNDGGFRANKEYSIDKPVDTVRIICLGDSITFGWGLNKKYTYPELLRHYLSFKFPLKNIEVINAGCPGYSSRQGLIYLDRSLLDYQPDLVIVQFGYNDGQYALQRTPGPVKVIEDNEFFRGKPGQWQPIPQTFDFKILYFLNKIIIYKFSKLFYGNYCKRKRAGKVLEQIQKHKIPASESKETYKERGKPVRVCPDDFEKNLEAIHHIVSQAGSKIIFIDAWPTQLPYRKRMSRVAQKHNIQVVSQFNMILKSKKNVHKQKRFIELLQKAKERHSQQKINKSPEYLLLVDYVHPNEIANILFVEELTESLAN